MGSWQLAVNKYSKHVDSLKGQYNEGSKYISQGISQILNGQPASSVLPSIESRLERLVS